MNSATVSSTSIANLSPLNELGAESLQKARALARQETLSCSLQNLPYPWSTRVVYLIKGQLMINFPGEGVRVLVGGNGRALYPLARTGLTPCEIRPVTDCEIICFDAEELDVLLTWDQIVPSLKVSDLGNGDSSDWHIMSGIFDSRRLTFGNFAHLPAANIEALIASFQRRAVRSGEVVIRQGEPGDYYYVIERGRAQVTRDVAGARIELAQLAAGDAFGEEALIAETCRNASVSMTTDGELLRLDGADFTRLLREPLIQKIDAQEASRRAADGMTWLDVRFPAEYRHDGLRQAINIPLNELRDSLETLSRDREYVVYCQSGRRSSAAVFLMSQRGFKAYLLEGGMKMISSIKSLEAMAA